MTKWKPLELPVPMRIVNQKCLPLSWKNFETNNIMEDLKDAGVVIPTKSTFNSLICLIQKTDKSWEISVDYLKPNRL